MNQPANQEISRRMIKLEDGLAEFIKVNGSLRSEIAELKESVDETREIVKAWEAVKTGGKFVKWLGALAAAIAAIVVAIKGGIALAIK